MIARFMSFRKPGVTKNQLSFNKALETQLAQLAAATPAAELGKIPGQPESTLQCHQCYVERAP